MEAAIPLETPRAACLFRLSERTAKDARLGGTAARAGLGHVSHAA